MRVTNSNTLGRPIAIVTGANRGLGFETCRGLGREGFSVVLTSRAEDGEQAAHDLQREGIEVAYHPLDVTDPTSVASFAAWVERHADPPIVLVNNAAVSLRGFDAGVARRTLETNFFGAERVTEALLPRMRPGGRITMVSSALGELACLRGPVRAKFEEPTLDRDGLRALAKSFVSDVGRGRHAAAGWPSSAYAVSKVALNALTRILANELSPRRITVNAVSPGWVRTAMGGASAPRSIEEGAALIVRAAVDGGTGLFLADGKLRDW